MGLQVLPSVPLVLAKCKKFDDGMYAAVELAADKGIGKLAIGKRELLWQLLTAMGEAPAEGDFARRAARLAVSRTWAGLQHAAYAEPFASDRIDESLMEDHTRKPVGFYTWSLQLERIFKRNTHLQHYYDLKRPLEVAAAAFIAHVIMANPEGKAEYVKVCRLMARITNRLTAFSPEEMAQAAEEFGGLQAVIGDEAKAAALGAKLNDLKKPGFAVLSPSMAKENWDVLQGGMDQFIQSVRDGTIDLKPDQDSGWYEYQQYSLEPLLAPDKMPEGAKLEMDDKYLKLLESSFKSLMSQVRETHVGQLDVLAGMAPPVDLTLAPDLRVEPVPTTYSRYAEGYAFLRAVLQDCIGPEALALAALDEGAVARPDTIDSELAGLTKLLLGCSAVACQDIGLPEPLLGSATLPADAFEYAQDWLANWHEDPDMARDVRMMIPVSVMPNRFWAVIGVRLTKLRISYDEFPQVPENVEATWSDTECWLPTEQFIEITGLEEPLNRKEFRALCDEHQTAEKITRALGKKGGKAQLPDLLEEVPQAQRLLWVLIGLVILVLVGLVVWRLARSVSRKG